MVRITEFDMDRKYNADQATKKELGGRQSGTNTNTVDLDPFEESDREEEMAQASAQVHRLELRLRS